MNGITRRARRSDDEGFTMLAVLASAFLVMALVLVGIGYAMTSVQRARTSQDSRGALAAAQAGVQEYLSRLNNCPTYFAANNTCGVTDNALGKTAPGTGEVVPGTTGTTRAYYRYTVLSTPLDSGGTGGVRLKVTGEVDGKTRTLTVDLTRSGFLKYLYYTDYETFSPANTRRLFTDEPVFSTPSSTNKTYTFTGSGSSKTVTFPKNSTFTVQAPTLAQVTKGCQRYHYALPPDPARTTFPRTVTVNGTDVEVWPGTNDASPVSVADNFTCLTISFSGNDSFDGPVHSNDSLRLSGPVTFKQAVTTGWNTTGTPYYGTSDPSAASKKPTYHDRFKMPETASEQLQVATQAGCVYTGPTQIKFLSSGKLQVMSPNTVASSVNSGCSTGSGNAKMTSVQTVNGPANGVVFVKSTTTAGNCITAFQSQSGDITDYDNNNCRAGDAFVQGDVSGQFTIAAEHDVVVTSDVKYTGGKTGQDVLGLIGQNNVVVWHPVKVSNGQYVNMNGTGDLRIDAAIASVSNSFTVFNYSQAPKIGTLQINGVIIQKFRGPVATGSGTSTSTGYAKDYRYDSRLQYLPPPSFIAPVNDPWSVSTLSEQKS